jgi:monoamine oxidase
MHVDTLIIGAGLSGLYTAYRLHQAEQSFLLLEARSRLGGRILSLAATQSSSDPLAKRYDLGPAWIWPGFQPLMSSLIKELKLPLFQQQVDGDLLYEESHSNQPHRHGGPSAHTQSFRIAGGAQALIEALSNTLPAQLIQNDSRVTKLEQTETGIKADVERSNEQHESYYARQVILALPPRLIRHSIAFNPELTSEQKLALDDIPTWMAGHAKILFLYEHPFWRKAGLSGEVFSHKGPMTEIYDASPSTGGPYALFGFLGIDSNRRREIGETTLTQYCLDQLVRLFGQDAQNYAEVLYQDWTKDPYTSTPKDTIALPGHPEYGLPPVLNHLWEGKIILSGSETAHNHGGYLEGALEAAESCLRLLKK